MLTICTRCTWRPQVRNLGQPLISGGNLLSILFLGELIWIKWKLFWCVGQSLVPNPQKCLQELAVTSVRPGRAVGSASRVYELEGTGRLARRKGRSTAVHPVDRASATRRNVSEKYTIILIFPGCLLQVLSCIFRSVCFCSRLQRSFVCVTKIL